MWITQNESAKFWLSVLTDLQQRGVKDIFIACIDGLTGFPAAIETVFPKTQVQLYVFTKIRFWCRLETTPLQLKPDCRL
jgi:transposase-like protein